jgi:transcription elongation factor GreA
MLDRTIKRLGDELKALEREYRHELPKAIQTAVAMGDLRENAEYKAALERQQYVRARIGQVQQQLKTLAMVDLSALPKDRAALGSTVGLYDAEGDREISYELVIPEEAEFSKGMVSVNSPIGKALIGRQEGDQVTIRIPAGTRVYEIIKLQTLHDKEE